MTWFNKLSISGLWNGGTPVPVSNTDPLPVKDRLTGEEYLEDQPGAGSVLDFTFAVAPDIVFVYSKTLASRATFNTVAPTATKGVMCDADVATPVILSGQTELKVFAPVGAMVSVWGFRYT